MQGTKHKNDQQTLREDFTNSQLSDWPIQPCDSIGSRGTHQEQNSYKNTDERTGWPPTPAGQMGKQHTEVALRIP